MKLFKHPAYVIVLFATFYFGFLLSVEAADETCDQWVAKAVSVLGLVEARKVAETSWVPVKLNDTFCAGDMIRVQEKSRAAIVLSNETNLSLDQKTTITFVGVKHKKTFLLDLLSGAAHFFSRFPRRIKVLTPFVNASVEGTEGFISVEKNKALLTIFEGKVLAANAAGSLTLTGGQSAVTEASKTPVLRVVARPRDAVHWALYYPPAMYLPSGEAPIEDMSDPRFLVYRASQLLAVGRVDEAEADIKQALSLDPKYSNAFALQSIIAVVQNEKDKALGAAQKAIDTEPNSATARIAMSYAQQADFDLESARASIEEAVKLDPNNALAWARLAELWASFGRLGKALDAAKKAVDLDPNLSRTQMVLGFAYLAQVKTTASKTAFEKAIELDQADPLSRLGLGLAKIRDGDLKAGAREIEIAASLNPNNSIVRSYLGKTYFEEKRDDLDGREYAIAKELDPNDPTPWFYDAIRKQTINRPVEALHDLQKAKELNKNRAVYRSKLLLDSDEAARSASLARIYNDLGFQQRALIEGWQSVNTDPSNFSAHRFLADSYAVLPRHEIARVSELLQSQLLQPINITPIQPRLAERNLFLINAGGPSGLSFNEFNPIFNRNRLAVQGSGLLAENDTYGGEGIASGIYQKISGSAGYTNFETDGFRENNDQDDDIANVFAQLELTHKTSIQAEYRYRETKKGDLLLRFDPDNFFPNRREEKETESMRFGLHHAFSPGSHLIGNFIYSDSDLDVKDRTQTPVLRELSPGFLVPGTVETISKVDNDNESYGGELQYQFRSKFFDIVSGAGHFDIDSNIKAVFDATLRLDPPFPSTPIPLTIPPESSDINVEHTNLYLYSYIDLPGNVTLTVGASGDFFDGGTDVEDENQFNPKFGIIWNPFTNTTLRGAIFRTLTRTLVDARTVEPTQVAGFNQLYDEFRSTDAWRYGGAIDQKFSERIYGGAEFTVRDLDVPFPDEDSTFPDQRVDWKEYLGRAYFFYTPHKWLSLSAEYLYEEFDYDKKFNVGAEEVETHSFPLGINFFHPSGFGASIKATYYDQDGNFEILNSGEYKRDDDNFWVVDASINYRLPGRYGFITAGATNLFDEEFNYYDTDINNPRIQPERYLFIRATLAFP